MTTYEYLLPTRGSVLEATSPADLSDRLDRDVLDLAVEAESLGYNGLWIGDSVLAKPRPEPLTTLAAIAGRTDEARLGTAVYLPTLRHPIHVAHQLTTLDLLSGGRTALGVGVGRGPAVEAEYETLGLDYERRGRLLDESLEVMAGLLDGATVTYDGRFHDITEATLGMEPVGDVPTFVAYKNVGEEGTFPRHVRERIVDHAGGWLPISIPPSHYRAGLTSIHDLLAEAGRDPDRFDPAFYINVVVGDDEAAAIDKARTFLERYYPRLNDMTDDEVRTHGVYGPPAMIADRIAAYRDAGVESFVVRFTGGDQAAQLRRFAADVR
jgi:alkanesulfonate monooxygenase SsuD/methylene tetrahydromethanopterin reductase-like flavin-dependent oxidoreductase (luciferase family)